MLALVRGWKLPAVMVAAGFLVSLAGTPLSGSAQADPLPDLTSFDILYSDAFTVEFGIGAPPELAGAPCTILEGMAPYVGTPTITIVLQPGMNSAIIPQHGFPWYTATGPGFNPASRPADDDDIGSIE